MKPYDWSVVEPDITEVVACEVCDEPHFRRLTLVLLALLLAVTGLGIAWSVWR